MINNWRVQEESRDRSRIDSAPPDAAAPETEIFRMFSDQDGLGFTIAALLLQVRANSRAAIMPDETGRTEANFAAGLFQTPAKIHIVSGLPENRIEPVDLFQRPLVKSHVATGNVLRLPVGQHYMSRAAGRSHHRAGNQRIFGRQKIRPANADKSAVQQIAHKVIKPVFVGAAISVGESHNLAGCRGNAGIAHRG